MPNKQRVALGLSGGVDSAVSAALLLEQGYAVDGFYMECWNAPGCRNDKDRQDALDVALQLGIKYEVIDLKKAYAKKVVTYFKDEYAAGRTPNPDTMCNREIKFGLFYEEMIGKRGYDYVATGHYARVATRHSFRGNAQTAYSAVSQAGNFGGQAGHYARIRAAGNQLPATSDQRPAAGNQLPATSDQLPAAGYELWSGVDRKKDQSYFLYLLRGEQLQHILFPIGDLTKEQVRLEADKRKLVVAKKPDSQGICFIGEVSVPIFLKSLGLEEREGEVIVKSTRSMQSKQGMRGGDELVIGRHRGAWFYTIGQRIGQLPTSNSQLPARELMEWKNNLRLRDLDPSNLPPLYVIAKDVRQNVLVAGTREECMKRQFEVADLHWIDGDGGRRIWENRQLQVRIRHQGELLRVRRLDGDGVNRLGSRIGVELEKSVFGIAPGQACVFYEDQAVLGGGIICNGTII